MKVLISLAVVLLALVTVPRFWAESAGEPVSPGEASSVFGGGPLCTIRPGMAKQICCVPDEQGNPCQIFFPTCSTTTRCGTSTAYNQSVLGGFNSQIDVVCDTMLCMATNTNVDCGLADSVGGCGG